MKNAIRNLVFGIYWNYTVYGPDGPIKGFGQVFYITDDFGNLVLVDRTSLNLSLQG